MGGGPWGIWGCSSMTLSHVAFFMRLHMDSRKRDSASASGPCGDVHRIHRQQVLLEVSSGRLGKGVSLGSPAVGGIPAAELPGPPLRPLLNLLSLWVCFGPSRRGQLCSAAPARFPSASPSAHRFLLCIPLPLASSSS